MSETKTILKAAYHTLGCKLNFSETSTIGKMLEARGITRASGEERPDLIVINTCSVTEMADKKGRQLIRRLTKENPDATVVVTGCYAQLKPEQIAAMPGVAIVLGSNEKLRIAQYLDRWLDGSDYFCTYCTIPFARGRSRSGRIEDITAIARQVAAEGGKEIVITGVNIGDFGRDSGEKLIDLLKSLDSVEGIERYRIDSGMDSQ